MARDKWLHLAVGFVLAFTVSLFAGPWAGVAVAFTAGLSKEVYDYFTPGHVVDPEDLIATILGGVIGVIPVVILG